MNSLPAPRVEVHESRADLATTVAGAFVRLLTVRQASGDVPQVALTGGTIAGRDPPGDRSPGPGSEVDWSRVEFFWGDERFVAPDSDGPATPEWCEPTSSTWSAWTRLGSTRCRPPADAADVEAAATSYADEVRAAGSGRFALVYARGRDRRPRRLAVPRFPRRLDVDDRIAVGVTGSPNPPPERVSLTFAALNRADEVLVRGQWRRQGRGRRCGRSPPRRPTSTRSRRRGPRRGRDDLVPRPRVRQPRPLGVGAGRACRLLSDCPDLE